MLLSLFWSWSKLVELEGTGVIAGEARNTLSFCLHCQVLKVPTLSGRPTYTNAKPALTI